MSVNLNTIKQESDDPLEQDLKNIRSRLAIFRISGSVQQLKKSATVAKTALIPRDPETGISLDQSLRTDALVFKGIATVSRGLNEAVGQGITLICSQQSLKSGCEKTAKHVEWIASLVPDSVKVKAREFSEKNRESTERIANKLNNEFGIPQQRTLEAYKDAGETARFVAEMTVTHYAFKGASTAFNALKNMPVGLSIKWTPSNIFPSTDSAIRSFASTIFGEAEQITLRQVNTKSHQGIFNRQVFQITNGSKKVYIKDTVRPEHVTEVLSLEQLGNIQTSHFQFPTVLSKGSYLDANFNNRYLMALSEVPGIEFKKILTMPPTVETSTFAKSGFKNIGLNLGRFHFETLQPNSFIAKEISISETLAMNRVFNTLNGQINLSAAQLKEINVGHIRSQVQSSIIHGDAHLGNFTFDSATGTVGMIDVATMAYGSPLRDYYKLVNMFEYSTLACEWPQKVIKDTIIGFEKSYKRAYPIPFPPEAVRFTSLYLELAVLEYFLKSAPPEVAKKLVGHFNKKYPPGFFDYL